MDPTDIIILRHAAAQTGGRLCGRLDVPARVPGAALLEATRDRIGPIDRLVCSPALRCRMTAEALFPGMPVQTDPRLWEQFFGDWEGQDPARLPDLGPMDRAALAAHRPPGGESFDDLCQRTGPALSDQAQGGRVLVVAHAGTVRAALSQALGLGPVGLAFDVAPLSVTHLRAFPGGDWAVLGVNVR